MAIRLPASERRSQLLAAALEVFASKGYHATSMNDVADTAGITKPVLYQHFASKRQLYRELLAEVGDRALDEITSATSDATSPHEQVNRGMAAFVSWVWADSSAFRLLFGGGARRDEEFERDVRSIEASIAQAIAELIDADVEPQHRLILAHGVFGMAEGTLRHLVNTNAEFDPRVVAQELADLAWAGLRGIKRI
jgi:AcrR family transcriptional regulator